MQTHTHTHAHIHISEKEAEKVKKKNGRTKKNQHINRIVREASMFCCCFVFEYCLVPAIELEWIGLDAVEFFLVLFPSFPSFRFFGRLNQIFKVDSMALPR